MASASGVVGPLASSAWILALTLAGVVRSDHVLERGREEHHDVELQQGLVRDRFRSGEVDDGAGFFLVPLHGREVEPRGVHDAAARVRYRDHLEAQHLLPELVRERARVPVSLDRGRGAFQLDAEDLGRLANREDAAAGGRVAASFRSAQGQGLAGDHAEFVVTAHERELVHHPRHDLRGRVDVGSRDVLEQPEHAADLTDVGTGQALELAGGHLLGVADDPALAASERDVDDRGLPGHPRRQRAHRVDRLVRMEADTALRGSARVIVLDPEPVKDLRRSIVHLDREGDVHFTNRPPEELVDPVVELEDFRRLVELTLGDVKGVVGFGHTCGLLVSGIPP